MKKTVLLLLVFVALFALAACEPGEEKIVVQGVTDTEIIVGNTAATSGAFAAVGVPFNAGIEAYFKQINDAGGVNGRTITFITYDDTFDQATGITYTKKLVEEDKVFALVGHFGTPTVGGTVDYIQEVGVPMVYAATGINALYFQESPANPVMAVQPIYKTDGRVMTARALNESLFGANADQKLGATDKVGVLYTTSDDGMSIKEGIEFQAAEENRTDSFIYKSFSAEDVASLTTAILELKTANVGAVIIAANQVPFKTAAGVLSTQGVDVPVFTSYVNANASAVDATVDYGFDMYANAWIDIVDATGLYGFSQAYWDFVAVMTAAGYDGADDADDLPNYTANAYSMAGYIAASLFVEGLERVGTDELTWASYIAAMEESPLTVPMGGLVDFTDGKRWGIASMALLKLNITTTTVDEVEVRTAAWAKIYGIETLDAIVAK